MSGDTSTSSPGSVGLADSSDSSVLPSAAATDPSLQPASSSRPVSVEERVSALERAQGANSGIGLKMSLQVAKLVFGAWPAFGFVFLILFYVPLRDVLTSIPDKVKNANEIELPGLSLRSAIRRVAEAEGLSGVARAIPQLSSSAVEYLLRAPRVYGEGVISYSYSPGSEGVYDILMFPTVQALQSMAELEKVGFVALSEREPSGSYRNIRGEELIPAFERLRRQFPGEEEIRPKEERVYWRLKKGFPRDQQVLPSVTWTLTESGRQGIVVIVRAVATELANSDQQRP